MGRRKKKKPLKLSIGNETTHSVIAVVLIMIGILIAVSFTGQGDALQVVNRFLSGKFGMSMLFFPFIFISAGMVLFKTKWAWSRPSILLGTMMLMVAIMGIFQSGDVGQQTYTNLSSLITPVGSYIVFIALAIASGLIMGQWSFSELFDSLAKSRKKKLAAQKIKDKESSKSKKDGDQAIDDPTQEELSKSKGFSIPKLGLPFGKSGKNGKNKGFAVNDSSIINQDPGDQSGTALSEDQNLSNNIKNGKSQNNNNDMNNKKINSNNLKGVGAEGKNKEIKRLPLGDEIMTSIISNTGASPKNMKAVWEYPPLSLLSGKSGGKADRGDVRKNASIIENTLESFGIKAKVAEVNYGPSVTQYALEITRGTKLSKITGLSTDLALALAAPTGQVRIEAPIIGRSLVGIEVPNHSAQFVTLKTMLASKKMKKHKSKLAVALGINVAGKPVVADISKMPHVLIAGATGSGKSVAVNSFMTSILFRASPDEVKFILVDPKRVELTGYNGIPHLLTPVIVDPKKVVSALKWATALMDKRYKQLAEVGVKNIAGYNELAGLIAMPHIVIVIDELADIMLFSPKEVEDSITRIAQMARAVGIHLVLATQRPSVDVITGLIKANVPTRIAFNVSSVTDSRVILDTPGAEKLLGRGDMLYVPPDQAKPSRIQGTFVSDNEAKNLIDFIKAQGAGTDYEDEITTKYKSNTIKGGSGGSDGENRDAKFAEAARLFANYDKASSSLIQRRLAVGYARAARILDQLFEAGMVGPPEGSKPRGVNNEKINAYLGGLGSMEE